MVATLVLSSLLFTPAAPVPKAARPPGPPPTLLLLKPGANGAVTVYMAVPYTTKQATTVMEIVDGKQVARTEMREATYTRNVLVSLEAIAATYATAGGAEVKVADIVQAANRDTTVLAASSDGLEIDPTYRKMLKPETYIATGPEAAKMKGYTATRIVMAPAILSVKADAAGAKIPVYVQKTTKVMTTVSKVVDGKPATEQKEIERITNVHEPLPLAELKPDLQTADGKAVPLAEGEKRLAGGALVLTSALSAEECRDYLKAFQPEVLFLSSPQFVPSGRSSTLTARAKLAVPAQAILPALPIAPAAPAPAK